MRHLINIIAGYAIVWGAVTAITCVVNYIALPVFLIGLVAYAWNNGLVE